MNPFLLIFLGLLPVFAFVVGVKMSRGSGTTKQDRAELKRLRAFEADALALAYEHTAYGDSLAPKIIDLRRRELP